MLFSCIKIFLSRIIDVSLGTIRTVLFVKGKVIEPFIIAFFEVLIWYLVVNEALNVNGNILMVAAFYAGGYATGTLIGAYVSKKLINGYVNVEVFIKYNKKLINDLRNNGYKVSSINLDNSYDNKKRVLLIIEVMSKEVKRLFKIINKYDNSAFIIVNDTKYVKNGFVK